MKQNNLFDEALQTWMRGVLGTLGFVIHS